MSRGAAWWVCEAIAQAEGGTVLELSEAQSVSHGTSMLPTDQRGERV